MNNITEILAEMQDMGMEIPTRRRRISIPDARINLYQAMRYIVSVMQGRELVWLPEYEEVAKWLSDNQGKGLMLYGTCGQGKSLIARYAIPMLLLSECNLVMTTFDAVSMNRQPDAVRNKALVSIDDIGVEDTLNEYGTKRLVFLELLDEAEKNGNVIVATSNLTPEEMQAKYGDRGIERIKATMKRVLFTGKSLRA